MTDWTSDSHVTFGSKYRLHSDLYEELKSATVEIAPTLYVFFYLQQYVSLMCDVCFDSRENLGYFEFSHNPITGGITKNTHNTYICVVLPMLYIPFYLPVWWMIWGEKLSSVQIL